jgi:uncharacterized protein (TIGR03118 family)
MSRTCRIGGITLGIAIASLPFQWNKVLAQNSYFQRNLVSDIAGMAEKTDTNLVNPWGIAISPTSLFWVSDNHAGVSTLYDGNGVASSLVVTIPPPSGGTPPAAPTGVVFNSSTNFQVSPGAVSRFIFATEDGTIVGWNSSSSNGVVKVDNSASSAIYKGLAIGSFGGSNYLYAANFFAGTIDVIDQNYGAATLPGSFLDPNLPPGFAPFNVQNFGGQLYVTYAKQDASKHDDVPGAGNGFVNIFDTSGNIVRRLISNGALNSPWGLVLAPTNFGAFSGALLVGNFGNGKINAFDPATGNLLGSLQDPAGNPIQIQGLWGLIFGNGVSGGDTRTLYFAAGIAGSATNSVEDHGLFGSISALSPTFSAITDGATTEALNWVGGTAPFLLQKKASLSDPAWFNVLTTTNRSMTLAKESGTGFYRLQGLATNTVLPFTAYLDGPSEVPVNAEVGTGIAAFSLEGSNLIYYISFSKLTGPATAAHIHAPNTPLTSGVVMTPFTVAPTTSGTISGKVALSQDQITNLVNGLCYVNIHTAAHSGGEIRGQIVPLRMLVTMNGASEVPAVPGNGTATATLTFVGSRLLYTVNYSGLSSPASAMHIHGPADPTIGAGVLVPLTSPTGTNGTVSGSVTLTPQNMAYLLAGQTYMNIHTANNSGGEIRGQIWPIQFRVNMSGYSEVPITASAGTGSGIMNIISNKLSYSFSFTNLMAPASAGHIHGPASPTISAGVLIPFTTVPAATSGSFTGSTTLTSLQLYYMISGLTYANIHSAVYVNGEIRGQVVPHN